jgi:hypothetical protein
VNVSIKTSEDRIDYNYSSNMKLHHDYYATVREVKILSRPQGQLLLPVWPPIFHIRWLRFLAETVISSGRSVTYFSFYV